MIAGNRFTSMTGAMCPRLDESEISEEAGAGEGIRTLDFNLGKVALYP
jgi:hypothetical protein